ncbi:hypothetical protein I4U23_019928 [Adineta vaga]|nr:hypothetical protein I4U23_019928 [Adineta vaga]
MPSSYILSLDFIGQQITIYWGISIMIAGCLGESLNIIIFLNLQTFRQSSCAFYLTMMSMVNICQLLSGLLSRIMTNGYGIDWSLTSAFYCKFRFYLYHVSAMTSSSCLCLAVIDQYLATSASPRWQRWPSIKIAHRLTIVAFFIWIGYNIPALIYNDYIVSATTRKPVCIITNIPYSQFNNYINRFAFGKLLPICVTCIFGILAFRNVKQMGHRALPVIRRALDQQLTVMVLLQAVAMLITNVPYIIAYLLQLSPDLASNEETAAEIRLMISVTVCLLYMSFATPFYVYCCASNRFRRQLGHVLFGIYLTRDPQHIYHANIKQNKKANHNGKPVQFLSGMFVLYDSTERFFTRLMLAKTTQPHSDEHHSGFIRRPVYFTLNGIKSLVNMLLRRKNSLQRPFIYLRGDESSHFHERGNKYDRWHLYPAYGMDIMHRCMPNEFSHILFGKLINRSINTTRHYHGDRIYIKPEKSGLQQFEQYLAHANHYIRAVTNLFLCRFIDRLAPKFCTPDGAFHEWTDRRLLRRWTQILATIDNLTRNERRCMQEKAFSYGILEIYHQSLMFPSLPLVENFRVELEHRYGSDIGARKGHEIIFTTEQLLNSSPPFTDSSINDNQQCVILDVIH